MTCKELIAYLSGFEPDASVGIVIVDTEKRLHHITTGYQLLVEQPAILLETTESEPMDAVLEEITEDENAPAEAATSDQRTEQNPATSIPPETESVNG